MKKLKNTKGITLIALVITIIVLLILAGVTIASLTGNNGLLNRATNAKEETEVAQEKEQLQVEILGSYDTTGHLNLGTLKSNVSHVPNLTHDNSATFPLTVASSKTKKIYIIDDEGNTEVDELYEYDEIVTSKLTAGKYVNYTDGNGNEETYRVLYDTTSGYGWIEIISVSPLDTVTLGNIDPELPSISPQGYDFTGTNAYFEKARWSYNNAIETLNKKAITMLNTTYSSISDRVRCVGSDPKNPAKDTTELGYAVTDDAVNAYIKTKGYNNKFKVADNNYTNNGVGTNKDWDQLDVIGARNYTSSTVSSQYWLASREVRVSSNNPNFASSSYTYFSLVRGNFNGSLDFDHFCYIYSSSSLGNLSGRHTFGFRPVIRLKSGVKISNPDAAGTSTDPFELTI